MLPCTSATLTGSPRVTQLSCISPGRRPPGRRGQQPGRLAVLPYQPEGGGGEQQGEGDALHPEKGSRSP